MYRLHVLYCWEFIKGSLEKCVSYVSDHDIHDPVENCSVFCIYFLAYVRNYLGFLALLCLCGDFIMTGKDPV